MQKRNKLLTCHLLFQILLLVLPVFCVLAEGLQASYLENSGKQSVLEIRIEDPAPSSVIVKQHLPAGAILQDTTPAFTKYNTSKAVITWLFKRPAPGSQKIVTRYKSVLEGKGASAVIRCKSPSDGSLMTIRVQ